MPRRAPPPPAQFAAEVEREGLRWQVEIPATLSSSALGHRPATVHDLSRRGCRVESRCRLSPGDTLILTLEGLKPTLARVAWAQADSIGLTFADPIGIPVIEMLAARHPRRDARTEVVALELWDGRPPA